ncbi:RICIN domain-containing protein [Streptomyces sp. NPDC053427]|uniref:RICIN domain-containing protein n=1 Tax=Streptomyces sp. NPDC053427 TaxID=3365701 RepID=UPI0037D29B6C
MAPVPNGRYTVTRPNEQMLTLRDGDSAPGTPAVILPPTGNPGEQEWEVQAAGNGTCTIRNLGSGTYLGYDGGAEANKPVGGYATACEWALLPNGEDSTFHLVVPGDPVDGQELALDTSLLRIFPPRTAIRPLDISDRGQAWYFRFHA